MKKFKKFIAITTMFCMILGSVAACSSAKSKKHKDKDDEKEEQEEDDDKIDGKYTGTMDLKSALEMQAGFEIQGSLKTDMIIELDDGNYTLTMKAPNSKDMDKFMESVCEAICENQYGMSLDEVAELSGISASEFKKEFANQMGSRFSGDEIETGTYEIDGEDIIFTSDEDGETFPGTLKNGKLTVISPVVEDYKVVLEK